MPNQKYQHISKFNDHVVQVIELLYRNDVKIYRLSTHVEITANRSVIREIAEKLEQLLEGVKYEKFYRAQMSIYDTEIMFY